MQIILEDKLQNLRELSEFLKVYQRGQSEYFKPKPIDLECGPIVDSNINVIAFYLPQFHQVCLNDNAWGRGFTDWTNVTKCYPFYPGHHQPHQPVDMGYYDLKNPNVLERQIQLAKYAGIRGFCFHYYSFSGRKVMDYPIKLFHGRANDGFNYMINWANENWSKKWDGGNKEVIIEQKHNLDSDRNLFYEILPHLLDVKYFKIHGKTPLMIYRPALLFPHLNYTLEMWRDIAKKEGVGDLLLLRSNFHETEFKQLCDEHKLNGEPFDGVVQFPPHGNFDRPPLMISKESLFNKNFAGRLFDYATAANHFLSKSISEPKTYPGVIPSWDNSARMVDDAIIYINSNPEIYKEWLSRAISISLNDNKNMVFVNAWNEWAEGAHLEPSSWYGYAHIESTRAAIKASQGNFK